MVYVTPTRRTLYRGTPRRITPVGMFTARRERAAERSTARRRLVFQSPIPRTITLKGYRTGPQTNVGFPPGTKIAFCNNTVNKWDAITSAVDTRTQTVDIVTAIARKTTGNEINLRERDMINLRGFSIRIGVKNRTQNALMTVRMALVYDKNKTSWTATDFFRSYGDSRTLDFDGSLAGGIDPCQLMVNPINRDKYEVLWERKVTLGPINDVAGGTNYSRTLDNTMNLNTYVPVNRQLRYTGPLSSDCADNLFLVVWSDYPNGVATDPISNAFTYQRFVVAHWSDPK